MKPVTFASMCLYFDFAFKIFKTFMVSRLPGDVVGAAGAWQDAPRRLLLLGGDQLGELLVEGA